MVHVTVGDGTGNGRAMPTLSENWNQTGPVTVTTYTNCETVDLYVNSTKVGTKKLSDFSKHGHALDQCAVVVRVIIRQWA